MPYMSALDNYHKAFAKVVYYSNKLSDKADFSALSHSYLTEYE